MPVITEDLANLAGIADNSTPVTFFTARARGKSTGTGLVTPTTPVPCYPVAGVITSPNLDPGPAKVRIGTETYDIYISNAAGPIRLKPLLDAAISHPPEVVGAAQQFAAQALAYRDAAQAAAASVPANVGAELTNRYTKGESDSRYAPIADLAEYIQDTVAGLIKGGTNVTTTYDDAANTFTINATVSSGGGGTDPEIVRDVIGAALVAGSGVTVNVDDAGDTLTIAVSNIPQNAVTGLTTALSARYTKTEADQTTANLVQSLNTKANTADFLALLDSDYVKKATRGAANGVATLDADGRVPAAQLPAASGGGGNDGRFTTPQAFVIGDGVTLGPYNLTHNMGTRAAIVSVRQKKAPFKEIRLVDVAHPSLSALQIITDKALPLCEVDVVGIIGTTDATMPSTATVSLVSKTDTQVVLSATATDNVAVDYINWFRGGQFIGTSPAGQNYTDTGRAPNTPYSYTATAVDTSGNESAAQSAAVQVTTNVSTTPPAFDTSVFISGNGNLSLNYAVPAGVNRPVYALVSHINSGATGSSASVTIGGTAATLVGYQGSNGQSWVGVYKRDNVPAGASVAVALTTGENYSALLAFSYAPVASLTALAGVGGGGTTVSSPSTAIAGNELLVSCFSIRESPTVAAGTLRASFNHSSGFQFIRVLEGAGASPQQNTMTMSASAAYACVSFKIAA